MTPVPTMCPRHAVKLVNLTTALLVEGDTALVGRWVACPASQCATAFLIEITVNQGLGARDEGLVPNPQHLTPALNAQAL